jgi:glycerol-3-phosphate dehydrogenase (NAD(P)+)
VPQKTIAILGAGVWGSALGSLADRNHHRVNFWSRKSDRSLESVIAGVDTIISAVAMAGVRTTIEQLEQVNLPKAVTIVTATKGLDSITTSTPSKMWQMAFPDSSIVVLSGPNLSQEIELGLPAATVVASQNILAAEKVQSIFASDSFRVYVNDDPLGTELGGTLKNITAIAAGVCDGLHLGNNAKAALLTRALPEMIRVGNCLGAKSETFFGLSGLGDLLTTCNSSLSRNYQVGYGLAQNKNVNEILSCLKGTAEGINTTKVLVDLADRQKIAVPIALEVYRLLQGITTPAQAVKALMERELKSEFGDLNF